MKFCGTSWITLRQLNKTLNPLFKIVQMESTLCLSIAGFGENRNKIKEINHWLYINSVMESGMDSAFL